MATIMLLTGLVGGFFFLDISDSIEEEVEGQIEATTIQHGNASVDWFDDRYSELDDVVEDIEDDRDLNPDQADPNDLWTALRGMEGEFDEIAAFHYVTPEGEIRGSSENAFLGGDYFEGTGFDSSDLEGGQFVLPEKYNSPAHDQEVMAVGLGGTLRADGNYIAEMTTDEGGPLFEHGFEGGETGIVTADDNHLFGMEPDIEMPAAVGDGFHMTQTDDEIYGYHPIPGQEALFAVTEVPQESAFELRGDILLSFGLTLLFAFVIILGVTVIGGRSALRDLNVLADRAETMGEGELDVDLETSRKDEIGVLYQTFDGMRSDLKTRIREAEQARDEAESAREEAEIARAEAEEMSTYLQEKAEEYSGIMQQVGVGDMTQRMTADGEEESMDRIAEEFNEMIEELEKTTGQLKSYVDEVEEAGSEVEGSAETVRDASEQVADSIQKISDDAYEQKERLQRVSETMDEATEKLDALASREGVDIDEPIESIQNVAVEVNDIAELSEETMAEAEHVAGAAEEQAAELNEVSERANDLQRYAQPLRDILGRFETEAEHEFVFSVGPTGGAQSPQRRSDDEA